MRNERLEKVIDTVGELPALPSIVADVLNITEDPTVAVSQISERIQRDPGLTAKILKVSNSSYYGMKQYVGTLKLALVILGVREVRNIVLGITLFESLKDGHMERLLTREIWEHSLRVAGWCRLIGSALSLGLQGEDFIGGLLHDVGKIVLLRQAGDDYLKLVKMSGSHGETLCQLEMSVFGFDHADAAAALADHWNLPCALSDALRMHHEAPERVFSTADDPRLAALVWVANAATVEEFSQPDAVPGPSCTREDAWRAFGTHKAPVDVAGRRAMLADFATQIQEMQMLFL